MYKTPIDKKLSKIFCLLFIFMIFCLMSSCSEKEAGEVLFENLLEGKEVSDIVLFKGFVYASGMEGVYQINLQTMEVETLDLGRIYMAKDMVVDDDVLYIGHDGGIIAFDGDNFVSILLNNDVIK